MELFVGGRALPLIGDSLPQENGGGEYLQTTSICQINIGAEIRKFWKKLKEKNIYNILKRFSLILYLKLMLILIYRYV